VAVGVEAAIKALVLVEVNKKINQEVATSGSQ
jgi:hypothetical protein